MSDRRKVFINCPYDKEYFNFFQLLVYFCFFFSYEPCFASEDFSSSSRIQKIEEMIEQSSIGIHDISRIKLTDNHPRFNMPFELGMDYMQRPQNTQVKWSMSKRITRFSIRGSSLCVASMKMQ